MDNLRITFLKFTFATKYKTDVFAFRTKHLIVDVIRVQAGDTLTEILETPATEEQVMNSEIKLSKKREIALISCV